MSTPSVTPNLESSMSYLGHSDSMLDLVGRIVSIHQHQQQQAMSQLQGAIQLQGAGFPVDTKAIMKFAKKAKLPIETNPENLKAWLASQMDTKAGNDTSAGKPQGTQGRGGGPQPLQAPQGASQSHQEAVNIANRLQRGEKVPPEEIAALRIRTLGEAMLRNNNLQAATEEQKQQNALQVESLKSQAMAGDKTAVGKLMSGGGVPFNFDQAKWSAANDEQRSAVLDIMAGHESKADFAQRATKIGDSLITSGKVTDPASAYKIANILASGGNVPAELQSKMKPYTFTELAQSASMASDLVQLGLPPDKIGSTIKAAEAGGLENALPTGMKPLATQQLALQRAQVGIEAGRLGLEKERLDIEMTTAKRMEMLAATKAMSEQQKADLDNFKSLVEIKKAGGKVSDDVIKGATVKAANALGMDAKEVKTFWDYITFSDASGLKFEPRLTDQGKGVVDKFTGKSNNKTPKPSDLQRIIDVVRGKRNDQGPI